MNTVFVSEDCSYWMKFVHSWRTLPCGDRGVAGASLAGTTRGWGTVGPSGTVAAGAVIAACCAMAAMQGGALVLGLGVLVQAAVGR